MPNLSKERRDRMIEKLEELKTTHSDDTSIAALNEIENALREKKYGLVWEEHSEMVDEMLKENIPVLMEDKERRLCKDENIPWNFIIEGDNLQALYLLEKTHKGKVDCIYIDPPYNTGARDWKYNNDYVDENDDYRHSKWLSMMKSRLIVAKRLLNPADSVLIVTIDEKEYLHLGCLLEEMFSEARIQMVSSLINRHGTSRTNEFSRTNEYIYFVMIGQYKISSIESAAYLSEGSGLHWHTLRRSTASNIRDEQHPNQFYPIYVSTITGKVVKVGDSLPIDVPISSIEPVADCETVFPLRDDGTEMMWSVVRDKFVDYLEKGYARVTKHTPNKPQKYVIQYLQSGVIEDIEQGNIEIIGREDDGSVIGVYKSGKESIPTTHWSYDSHDARDYGTKVMKGILGEGRFDFPKSLYAVKDSISLFVSSKKDSVIVDFFAGSGTTMHAVNLLNAEDGGHRKCILVTNNEVGETKEKEFIELNKDNPNCVLTTVGDNGKERHEIIRNSSEYKKFTEKWGIATYVSWPRIVCSIEGRDVDGKSLEGNYISNNTIENECKRNIKQISFLKGFKEYSSADKKDIIYLLSEHKITKKEIGDNAEFIIPENDDMSILLDDSFWKEWLDELEGAEYIKNYLIITENNKLFKTIKGEINERFGTYKKITPLSIPMDNGFSANVKMLRCSWTPRNPEDYLLSNALCLNVKELIELQTAQEVDGVKNVIILSKSDFKRIFDNPDSATMVEHVWVNENLLFSAKEMLILREKGFRYIPREYFSQELKEVGEYV